MNIQYWKAINKDFFIKNQKILLWFLNSQLTSKIFRKLLCIDHGKSSLEDNLVLGILPNAIFWKNDKNELVAEFRTHDKFSKRLYYCFEEIWWLAHYWDELFADKFIPELSFGFDTLTKYPDADPETSTIDGFLQYSTGSLGSGVAWSTLVSYSTATSVVDNVATGYMIGISTDNVSNMFRRLWRSMFLFDTSALTSTASISSAVFSVYGYSKYGSAYTFSARLYTCTPSSNTSISSSDFANFGTTQQSATEYSVSTFSNSAYNDWTLNSTGLTNVNKTGISKFAVRDYLDVTGTQPTWASNYTNGLECYYADQTGTSNDPKLVVTYTAGAINVKNQSILIF